MYIGYLAIAGKEVINTHRVREYARMAGLGWVGGCDSCESIAAGKGHDYVTPMLDTVKPPWWGSGTDTDALSFLGVMGLSMDNADDSTRKIAVTGGVVSGAYLGPLRYAERAITVRGVAIAASDCALDYGLAWLRSVDITNDCASSTVDVYACCPHLAASDCADPVCAKACIDKEWRQYHNARITSGPTVLRRREHMTNGAWAEIEFIITAGDPYIYAPPSAVPTEAVASVEVVDPTVDESPDPVDGFARTLPYPRPPSLVREPHFLPRDRWLRDVVLLPRPDFGVEVVPTISVWSEYGAPDIRVTLIGPEGIVGVYRMQDFPADGSLTFDFRRRVVETESNGIVRRNSGYVRDVLGAPMRWPRRLPVGDYEVWVDRPVNSPPLMVDADVAGRVSP